MTPFEAGVLVDNRPDMRDVTSTLVDLAVRGWLVIEELESEQLFGLIKDRDYAFELQKPLSTAGELKPRTFFRAWFKGEALTYAEEMAETLRLNLKCPIAPAAIFPVY